MTPLSNNINRTLSFFRYGTRLRPMRDWLVIIILAIVLFVLSIAWNTILFLRLTRGEFSSTPASAPDTTLTDSIEKTTTIFKNRAMESERYKNEYHFVDPSR
jgi:hypothetical protein